MPKPLQSHLAILLSSFIYLFIMALQLEAFEGVWRKNGVQTLETAIHIGNKNTVTKANKKRTCVITRQVGLWMMESDSSVQVF